MRALVIMMCLVFMCGCAKEVEDITGDATKEIIKEEPETKLDSYRSVGTATSQEIYDIGEPVVTTLPILTLHGEDGRQAVLDWSGDEVKYSGDLPIDEAAKIFFDRVLGHIKASD